MRPGSAKVHGARGFTMIVILMMIALALAGLAMASTRYTAKVQRDKEQELLVLGNLYAQALKRYYDSAPGNLQRYPKALEWLARDPRYVGAVRYVRKVYPDPLVPDKPWGLALNADGEIVGVFSVNQAQPLGTAAPMAPVPDAKHYSDWIFLADPNLTPSTLTTTGELP